MTMVRSVRGKFFFSICTNRFFIIIFYSIFYWDIADFCSSLRNLTYTQTRCM